jgi:hypothetical protein
MVKRGMKAAYESERVGGRDRKAAERGSRMVGSGRADGA